MPTPQEAPRPRGHRSARFGLFLRLQLKLSRMIVRVCSVGRAARKDRFAGEHPQSELPRLDRRAEVAEGSCARRLGLRFGQNARILGGRCDKLAERSGCREGGDWMASLLFGLRVTADEEDAPKCDGCWTNNPEARKVESRHLGTTQSWRARDGWRNRTRSCTCTGCYRRSAVVEELHECAQEVPTWGGQAARARQDNRHTGDQLQTQHSALQLRDLAQQTTRC